MSMIFKKVGLALLLTTAFSMVATAALTGNKSLMGHVPAAVSRLVPVEDLAPTNKLHLSIGLSLRNQLEMQALVKDVSDPTSPNYRHYLTTEEFTARFGPTKEDYQAVVSFAESNGMRVSNTHGNRMLLEVEANVSDVNRAFSITLKKYHHDKENRDFYAPVVEPSLSSSLPVVDVQGLDNYSTPKPRYHVAPAGYKSSSSKLGSGPQGNYMGYDYRSAYVPGTALTGVGQKVALFQFDGYISNDITLYQQATGLPAVSLTNVFINGFSGIPIGGGQGEVTLDIDMALSMAPGLNQIILYEGDPNNTSPNDILNRIATDNAARQVSSSWGWGGGPAATTDQIFQEMILQGQTFFDASGDSCAFLPAGASGNAPGSVDDPNSGNAPSDDPYIIQVGATTLQTSGPRGSYSSESVWNWGLSMGSFEDGVGSSGGISGYYPLPTWQRGVNMVTNQGSITNRNLPDVAMVGDNIFIIVNGVGQPGTGGTSCAAPLWAGFTALANQLAASKNVSPVGFINPSIYLLAKTSAYTNYFRDVTSGNNTWSQSPSQFYAVPGYDLCTGWGSPNGTNLINALVALSAPLTNTSVIISAPLGPWGTNMSVFNGSNPNGDWFLFIQDDAPLNTGMITNGWYLTLTTANPVGYASDNAVYASLTNTTIGYGMNYTLTIGVTNYGPSISTNVVVTDNLPLPLAGLPLISSNATLGTIALFGVNLTWNVGNLSVGNGASLTLTFRGYGSGTYTNTATVASFTDDPNPDDDSIVSYITVSAPPPPPTLAGFGYTGGSANQFQFTVNGSAVQTVVQASTNLVNWANVFTGTPPFIYTNFGTTNYPKRFYRAVVGP